MGTFMRLLITFFLAENLKLTLNKLKAAKASYEANTDVGICNTGFL